MRQGNIYKVSVTISQVGGYRPGRENPEYNNTQTVWSISESCAIGKVERQLQFELKQKYGLKFLEDGYCIERKCELIIENVLV